MNNELREYVTSSFSAKNSLQKYTVDAKKGLWASEEVLIDKYFEKNSYILDLGCGVGRTTFPLIKKEYKVIGVDLTPVFIETAKKMATKLNILADFEVGDATNLKFPNENFDNVLFSFNGWSMIPSKEARLDALKEIYRVLKPNGFFIFTFHKRTIFGQELMWLIQIIKLYVLKPLGYKTKEIDFGDFYFKKDSETTYDIEQFVSFLSQNEVKTICTSLGFKIELMKPRSEITKNDSTLTSGDVMFFVCKK